MNKKFKQSTLQCARISLNMTSSIFSPLQSKACLTFEFITTRVLSIQEDPYQAIGDQNPSSYET